MVQSDRIVCRDSMKAGTTGNEWRRAAAWLLLLSQSWNSPHGCCSYSTPRNLFCGTHKYWLWPQPPKFPSCRESTRSCAICDAGGEDILCPASCPVLLKHSNHSALVRALSTSSWRDRSTVGVSPCILIDFNGVMPTNIS